MNDDLRRRRFLGGTARPFRCDYGLTNLLRARLILNSLPSPPWGRGWLAAGALTSRGETGEGVKTVAPHSNLAPGIDVHADPLTPRLAVPPSPKGAREEELFVLSPYSWDTGHPIHHNLDSPGRRPPLQIATPIFSQLPTHMTAKTGCEKLIALPF